MAKFGILTGFQPPFMKIFGVLYVWTPPLECHSLNFIFPKRNPDDSDITRAVKVYKSYYWRRRLDWLEDGLEDGL